MDHYLLNIINQTTEYIETNLLKPINLDDISENVRVSKFHLLRIWKGATKTGLMEYVRRRRIALSLSDLLKSHNSIEFISSKYSFGCERSYNRIFKEEYNTTPAKWRKNPSPLTILDRFNVDYLNKAGESLVYLCSITILPKFSIAGLVYNVNNDDNIKLNLTNNYYIDFFYNHRHRVINPAEKDIYYGLTTKYDKNKTFSLYQPSIKINQISIVPPDFHIRNLDSHKYGVFKYIGLHRPEEITSKKLIELWQYIYETWLPTVEFKLIDPFRFEYINYARCSRHYCECDLYYPISYL